MSMTEIPFDEIFPGQRYFSIPESTVHLYLFSTSVSETRRRKLEQFLSPEEMNRAARFKFAEHKNRFIAARGMLRAILANYLNCSPDDCKFGYGEHGKPFVIDAPLHFNVSHAEQDSLIGFSMHEIGVDIEKVREDLEVDQLAKQILTRNELLRFKKLSPHDRMHRFYQLWTYKEAWVKATGKGTSAPLNQMDIDNLLSANDEAQCEWYVQEIDVLKCHYAAVVSSQDSNTLIHTLS